MASEIIKFRVAAGEKLRFVNAAQTAGMTVSDLLRRAGKAAIAGRIASRPVLADLVYIRAMATASTQSERRMSPITDKAVEVQPKNASAIFTIVLCFVALLLDGIDTNAISVAGPTIAKQFGIPPASLTMAFVMTSLGAVVGYLSCGHLCALWGARRVLIMSVAIFAVLTAITGLANSIFVIAALRFFTAVGLGAALPAAMAIVVDCFPRRLQEVVVIIVGTALALGGIFGGVLGGMVTARYGWECLFFACGALPLILVPFLAINLPTSSPLSKSVGTSSGGNGVRRYLASVKSLQVGELRRSTLCLWLFSFFIFSDTYALLFWMPSLLIKFGYPAHQAPYGVAVFSLGGLIANLALLPVVREFGAKTALLFAGIVAILAIVFISLGSISGIWLWLAIACAGGGLIACNIGQSALAVSIYSDALRPTGIGFSAAMGRMGSIFGPAAFGLLFSIHWDAEKITLFAVIPLSLAMIVLLMLGNSIKLSRAPSGRLGVASNRREIVEKGEAKITLPYRRSRELSLKQS